MEIRHNRILMWWIAYYAIISCKLSTYSHVMKIPPIKHKNREALSHCINAYISTYVTQLMCCNVGDCDGYLTIVMQPLDRRKRTEPKEGLGLDNGLWALVGTVLHLIDCYEVLTCPYIYI